MNITSGDNKHGRRVEKKLAPTTWDDLDTYLREDGPLMGPFGDRVMDEITDDDLREWWRLQAWSSTSTGKQYVKRFSPSKTRWIFTSS